MSKWLVLNKTNEFFVNETSQVSEMNIQANKKSHQFEQKHKTKLNLHKHTKKVTNLNKSIKQS
jgi:hypothetical protein